MESEYVVQVRHEGRTAYLFNTRTLLLDFALAKAFSTVAQAKRYFRRSWFSECPFQVLVRTWIGEASPVPLLEGETP